MKPGDKFEGGSATPIMSLRDYFAGQVLPEVYRLAELDTRTPMTPEEVAAKAYRIADAMILERAKTHG